jgi:Bacterial Ig-like domain (group 2)
MNGEWYGEQDGEGLFGYAEDLPDYYNPDLFEEIETYTGESYPETSADRLRLARAVRAQRARGRRGAPQRAPSPIRSTPPPRYLPPSPSNRPANTGQVSKGFERVGGDVQKIKAAVQTVDIENKLQADDLGRGLAMQRQRMGRSEYAFAASKVLDVAQQFPAISGNAFLKSAVPLAPLLLLLPERRGRGAESFITDPRIWGIGLGGALALFLHFQGQAPAVVAVGVTPDPVTLPVPATITLQATARDQSNRPIPGRTFNFSSLNAAVATVTPGGLVTAVAQGVATIVVVDTVSQVQGSATVSVPP